MSDTFLRANGMPRSSDHPLISAKTEVRVDNCSVVPRDASPLISYRLLVV